MHDPSGIPHGSSSVNDHGPQAQLRVASPLGPLLHSGPIVATQQMNTGSDVSLSDDSLGLTPPKPDKRIGAKQFRGRSLSNSSRIQIGLRRAASTGPKRSIPRVPSPAVMKTNVSGPDVVPPVDSSQEARLAALEQQTVIDHDVIRQMAAAIRNLQEVAEHSSQRTRQLDSQSREQVHMTLQLRRDIAANRDNPATEMTIQAITTICESKFAQLDVLVQQLSQRDGNVEAVVQAQHDKSKEIAGQDGAFIAGAFSAVDQKISQVGELVRKFDAGATRPSPYTAGPVFTPDMCEDMRHMHNKLVSIDAEIAQKISEQITVGVTPIYEGLNAVTAKSLEQDQIIQALQYSPEPINLCGAYAQCKACPTGEVPSGSPIGAAAKDYNPWGPPSAPPPGMGGSGSSGGGDALLTTVNAITGGNGTCHCVHVKELQNHVSTIQGQIAAIQKRIISGDPWHGGTAKGTPVGSPIGATDGAPINDAADPGAKHDGDGERVIPLPLTLHESLGSITHANRPMFDIKMTQQENFKFNGTKDGMKWKLAVERYLISCAPVLLEIFKWAETMPTEPGLNIETFKRAVGAKMTDAQVHDLNSQLWGFISNLISGSAETIFRRAPQLNGLDAWRRLVRHIDHGRELRLASLKREMKAIQSKPIKTLADVELGVAEYENVIQAYVQGGGEQPSDKDMKDDLLNVLPEKLQADLLWHAKDSDTEFHKFRDTIVGVSARLVAMQKPNQRPLQGVQEGSNGDGVAYRLTPGTDAGTEETEVLELIKGVSNVDDLIAAFQKINGKRRPPGPNRTKDASDTFRNPRKCPNCGEVHAERICPKPSVAVGDRKCWTCGKTGHSSAQCPNKKAPGGLKALTDGKVTDGKVLGSIEDALRSLPKVCFHVDREGFQQPRRPWRPRPKPSDVTVAQFVHKSAWEALAPTPSEAYVKPASGSPIGATGCGQSALGSSIGAADRGQPVLGSSIGVADRGQIIGCLEKQPQMEIMEVSQMSKKVKVAIDSAAVDNVIHPDDLPECIEYIPNTTDSNHFVGANNSKIENFGTCRTRLIAPGMDVGCDWTMADVTRALHSVAQVAGPKGEGNGKQDILFDNDNCFVVQPGVVKRIMQIIKAVAEYERDGNLYTREMEVTGFPRQGAKE